MELWIWCGWNVGLEGLRWPDGLNFLLFWFLGCLFVMQMLYRPHTTSLVSEKYRLVKYYIQYLLARIMMVSYSSVVLVDIECEGVASCQSHQVFLVNHLDRLDQQRLFLWRGPTQQPSNQSIEVKMKWKHAFLNKTNLEWSSKIKKSWAKMLVMSCDLSLSL